MLYLPNPDEAHQPYFVLLFNDAGQPREVAGLIAQDNTWLPLVQKLAPGVEGEALKRLTIKKLFAEAARRLQGEENGVVENTTAYASRMGIKHGASMRDVLDENFGPKPFRVILLNYGGEGDIPAEERLKAMFTAAAEKNPQPERKKYIPKSKRETVAYDGLSASAEEVTDRQLMRYFGISEQYYKMKGPGALAQRLGRAIWYSNSGRGHSADGDSKGDAFERDDDDEDDRDLGR